MKYVDRRIVDQGTDRGTVVSDRRSAYNRAFRAWNDLPPATGPVPQKRPAGSGRGGQAPWFRGQAQCDGTVLGRTRHYSARFLLAMSGALIFLYACAAPLNDQTGDRGLVTASSRTITIGDSRAGPGQIQSKGRAKITRSDRQSAQKFARTDAILIPEVADAPRGMIFRYRVGRKLEALGFRVRFDQAGPYAIRIAGRYVPAKGSGSTDHVDWTIEDLSGRRLLAVRHSIPLSRFLGSRESIFFADSAAHSVSKKLSGDIRRRFGALAFSTSATEGAKTRRIRRTASKAKAKPVRRARSETGELASRQVLAPQHDLVTGDPRDVQLAARRDDNLSTSETSRHLSPTLPTNRLSANRTTERQHKISKANPNESRLDRSIMPAAGVGVVQRVPPKQPRRVQNFYRTANSFFNSEIRRGAVREIDWSNYKIVLTRGAGVPVKKPAQTLVGRKTINELKKGGVRYNLIGRRTLLVGDTSHVSRLGADRFYAHYVNDFDSLERAVSYSLYSIRSSYFLTAKKSVFVIQKQGSMKRYTVFVGPFATLAEVKSGCARSKSRQGPKCVREPNKYISVSFKSAK